MKELFLGIVAIIILGIGSFLYQNAKNDPPAIEPTACTLEAKICPDGTTVGRTGPNCEFEMCPTEKVSFTPPEGFIDSLMLLSSFQEGRVGFYTKEPSTISNAITVHVFPLKERSFEDVVVANVTLSPSDMRSAFDDFETVTIDGRDVYRLIAERFEATVEVVYAVPLDDFAVLVSLRDIEVINWMEDFKLSDLEDLETVREVVASVSVK